ncbi:PfkB family carbohydrate kinase [Microbacterium sp. KR10-403]|uniref:PfkB family carbohydrate kinase n=1 Tax=Microbacterium sp. KR10-403 TaxID=3158581 RepID=UPI0032E3BACF
MDQDAAPVVVIGDALIDELRDGRSVTELVGGAALNVAVGLVRLGVPATLIAMVGDDEAGEHIRAYLHDYGVGLLATPGPRGSSRAVSTRTAGEPVYEFNDAAQHRRVSFGAAEREAIVAAPFTVVSCFPFDDAEQTAALAEAVGERPLAIDPNPRSGMLHDRAEFVRGFASLVPRCALVKVGDDDARLLYASDLDVVRRQLVEAGADAVVATAGAEGASLEAAGVEVTAPVVSLPGPVVDTMGAGDAVLSSLVASMIRDAPADAVAWEEALVQAMRVAAATVRFQGALLRHPDAVAMDLDRLGT